MFDFLKQYRLRRLDPADGYKPLDFGGGGGNGSLDAFGRIIAYNVYHPKHGYVTLTTAPPFDEGKRYDSHAVRAYRRSLVGLRGFGPYFEEEIVEHEVFLVEDTIPFIRMHFANGGLAEVVTLGNLSFGASILEFQKPLPSLERQSLPTKVCIHPTHRRRSGTRCHRQHRRFRSLT